MDPSDGGGDNRGESGGEKRDVRRPMNAFLIFCKRHRSMVREKHPDRDNRSVTRILGDLWANLAEDEKQVYTNLAKQYKDAFMKAHPDYKWHSSEKVSQPAKMATRPTNARPPRSLSTSDFPTDGGIMPGQLADPDRMGGLNLLLMAGQHSLPFRDKPATSLSILERRMTSPDLTGANAALLQLAEMCSSELHSTQMDDTALRSAPPKKRARHWSYSEFGHTSQTDWGTKNPANHWSFQPFCQPLSASRPPSYTPSATQASATHTNQSETSSAQNRDKKLQPTDSSSLSIVSGNLELASMNQKATSLAAVQEERQPGKGNEDIQPGTATVSDIGAPPKKKFTKLQDVCKTKQPAASSSPATTTGCLSDQNDNAIFTCGKLVVDHIIDRLFSATLGSDPNIATANLSSLDIEKARKILTADITEREKSQGSASRDMGRLLSEVVHKPQNLVEKVIEEAYNMDLNQFKQLETAHLQHQQETVETDSKPPMNYQAHPSESESSVKTWTSEAAETKVQHAVDVKMMDPTPAEPAGFTKEEPHDTVPEEDENFMQPVRKSQRRNRGQRYQELINEGIIQPSKERLAARRHEQTMPYPVSCSAGEDAGIEEDGERQRHGLKRSISESDSVSGDEKRYRTGDFDLEAEIATLPACSLEPVTRRRPSRKRSDSESSRKQGCPASPTTAETPVPCAKSPQQTAPPPKPEPLVGSQKRKARKHSISRLVASTDADSESSIKSPGIVTTVTLVRDATATPTPRADATRKPETSTLSTPASANSIRTMSSTTAAMTTTLPSTTMTTTSITTSVTSNTLSTTTVMTTMSTTSTSQKTSSLEVKPQLDAVSVIIGAAQKIQQIAEEKVRKVDRTAVKNGNPSGGEMSRDSNMSAAKPAPKMAEVSSEFTNLKELDDDTWIPCYIPKGKPDAGSALYAKRSVRPMDLKSGSKIVGPSCTTVHSAVDKLCNSSPAGSTVSSKDKSWPSAGQGAHVVGDYGKGSNSLDDTRVSCLDADSKTGDKAKGQMGLTCIEKKTAPRPGEKMVMSESFPRGELHVSSDSKGDSDYAGRKSALSLSLSCTKVVSGFKGASKPQQKKKPSARTAAQQRSSTAEPKAATGPQDSHLPFALSQGASCDVISSKKKAAAQEVPTCNKSSENDTCGVADKLGRKSSDHNFCKTSTESCVSTAAGGSPPLMPSEISSLSQINSSAAPISNSQSSQGSESLITSVPTLSSTSPSACYDFSTLTVVSSSALVSCVDKSVSMTTAVTAPSLNLEMIEDSSTMETAVGSQMLCQSPLPGSPSVGVVHS